MISRVETGLVVALASLMSPMTALADLIPPPTDIPSSGCDCSYMGASSDPVSAALMLAMGAAVLLVARRRG